MNDSRNALGKICRALTRKHSFMYFCETRPWDARNIVVRPPLRENMSLFLFSREIAVGRLRHVLRKLCDVTLSCVWRDMYKNKTRSAVLCVTHSYVYDTFMCYKYIYMCVNHSYVCDMTHSYVYGAFICVIYIYICVLIIHMCVIWLIHVCTTRSYVCDIYIYVC